jgi:hypothetical protein
MDGPAWIYRRAGHSPGDVQEGHAQPSAKASFEFSVFHW